MASVLRSSNRLRTCSAVRLRVDGAVRGLDFLLGKGFGQTHFILSELVTVLDW